LRLIERLAFVPHDLFEVPFTVEVATEELFISPRRQA